MAWVASGGFIVCLLTVFVCHDALLWRQYSSARDSWVKDGRPPGFFWAGEGSHPYLGSFNRDQVLLKFLTSDPEWARGDRRALALLLLLRVATVAAFISWAAGMADLLSGLLPR